MIPESATGGYWPGGHDALPEIYALDVEPHLHGDRLTGESSVTKGSRDRAVTDANALLEHCPPGTRAVLRHVERDVDGGYHTLSQARARHDGNGGIVWDKRWTR